MNDLADALISKEVQIPYMPTPTEEPPFTRKTKFEGYGIEMLEKEVKQSGNSGGFIFPPRWVGKHVKIICIEWSPTGKARGLRLPGELS